MGFPQYDSQPGNNSVCDSDFPSYQSSGENFSGPVSSQEPGENIELWNALQSMLKSQKYCGNLFHSNEILGRKFFSPEQIKMFGGEAVEIQDQRVNNNYFPFRNLIDSSIVLVLIVANFFFFFFFPDELYFLSGEAVSKVFFRRCFGFFRRFGFIGGGTFEQNSNSMDSGST